MLIANSTRFRLSNKQIIIISINNDTALPCPALFFFLSKSAPYPRFLSANSPYPSPKSPRFIHRYVNLERGADSDSCLSIDKSEMANQVVKVKRETIAACMTCPLCNKLFLDATTISECLHTFCRKCIYKLLGDDETECCPTCNIDLGCAPLEKLRPDHNLQDVRAKIFPSKRTRAKAPGIVPSVALPQRRKERSLSSLVVSTPRVSTQTAMTGRRSKVTARKKLRGSSFTIEKPIKKEENSVEDHPESSSSRETLNKFTQNLKQNSSIAEPSSHSPGKETQNGDKPWVGKVDLWKPLNYLVEVANRSKSSKVISQGSTVKSEPPHASKIEGHSRKPKVKDPEQKSNVQNDKNGLDGDLSESVKSKKMPRNRKRKAESAFGESGINFQAIIDAANASQDRKISPIWFSLVASADQEGAPLPQISANYLRIKDGSVPVSFIKKYLTGKLNLISEDEVEIKCMGQPVVPTLQLSNLVEFWLQTVSTSQKVQATIGSSAKEFVMVLAYARKVSVS